MDVKKITRDELLRILATEKNVKLIDALSAESYAKEHIKGAISIPLEKVREKAEKLLNKTDLIITYCGSFECEASTKAAKILLSMGYPNVLDYEGGLKDYKEANLPLEGALNGQDVIAARNVKFQGNPLTLAGRKIKVGMSAPNFIATNANLESVNLSNFKGKIKILTSFPSLDTPVCDLQVKEFNKRAAGLADNVVVVGISKDLPFAQQRFCQANSINKIALLSDYKTSSFGINYGMLIKENNLLARSITIVDAQDIIRYIQIVPELTTQPDYDDALNNLATIVQNPVIAQAVVSPGKCVPCEAGTPPLPAAEISKRLPDRAGWQLVEDKKLVKEFKFKDFVDATYFFNLLAVIAEEQGHHPTFTIIYNKLKITLTTHASGGLTENDFVMAKIIDEIMQ